jgi:biopolymer transport protein ExbD
MQVALRCQSIEPMGEMNTTPLIDVMLVLLIMFIVTIPTQTHGAKINLPTGKPLPDVSSVRNTVVIGKDGRILWNGEGVDINGLRIELNRTAVMQPQPELHLVPDEAARYAVVDEVLAETRRAHVTRLGFVGNERYSGF